MNMAVYVLPCIASISLSIPCTKSLSSVFVLSRLDAMHDADEIYFAVSPKISSITFGSTSFEGILLNAVPGKLLFNPFFKVSKEVVKSTFSFASNPAFLTPIYMSAGAFVLATSTITTKLHPNDMLA